MNYSTLQNFIQLSRTIVSNIELIQENPQIHKGKQENGLSAFLENNSSLCKKRWHSS